MATYTQADRPLEVTTPLGEDVLLVVGFSGHEAMSQLFNFHLELLAENGTEVPFDKLLGQSITLRLTLNESKNRYYNGICNRVSQGHRDHDFTYYRMEIVPQFWFLTRKAQSRIFQHISVPDILKKVLVGVDVSYEIRGTFQPRDFCVQYRETDFNFASRLMEEEGIFYFFKHTADGHKMVVANTPQSNLDMPEMDELIYEEIAGGVREEMRVHKWEKIQELRSGKYTLWDHSFELPHKHLEAEEPILPNVQVGEVQHELQVGNNDKLELYDYPGAYAQRFDGIDKGGGEQSGELRKIFEDNKRTVKIRMQQEALPSVVIQGASNCRHLVSGHKFTLTRHFSANGPYALVSLAQSARLTGDYRSGDSEFDYENSFTCIPFAIPYRPLLTTPKPVVQGTQTAVVVGPPGEEIFVDKYSRVKVQFHWDREGKNNADSSCWIRVGTLWAGKQWGVIHIPRIGQEVIVDFLEGDPDQPIIVGSVYNADQMPPYTLPANKTQSGIKSRSSLKGGPANFNEFRFEDKKGQEQVYLHAEKNQDIVVENDETHTVGHDRTKTIGHDETTTVKHDRTETVINNETITIGVDRTETVGNNEDITIGVDRTEMVGNNESLTVMMMRTHTVGINEMISIGVNQALTVGATREVTIGVNQSVSIGDNLTESVGKNRSTSIGKNDDLDVGKKITIVAGDQITLETGQSKIVMKKNGQIEITGMKITLKGTQAIENKAATITSDASAIHTIKGSLVKIN